MTTFGRKKKDIALALEFIEKGKCDGKDGYEIARQFNLIRDEFAKISPDKLVYDINNKDKKAPWTGKLSPVITSCANLYTTADGFDFFMNCYATNTCVELLALHTLRSVLLVLGSDVARYHRLALSIVLNAFEDDLHPVSFRFLCHST